MQKKVRTVQNTTTHPKEKRAGDIFKPSCLIKYFCSNYFFLFTWDKGVAKISFEHAASLGFVCELTACSWSFFQWLPGRFVQNLGREQANNYNPYQTLEKYLSLCSGSC